MLPSSAPLIGQCLRCRTDILASHPEAWCTLCSEPLPHAINMKRRPILYGTSKGSHSSLPRANLAPCPDCGNKCSLSAVVCQKCGRPFKAGDLKVSGPDFHPEPIAEVRARPSSPGWPREPYETSSISPTSSSLHELQQEKATRLAQLGAITGVVSAVAFFWGSSYTSNWSHLAKAGLSNLAGQTDPTFVMAQWCVTLGTIGFVVGLILFIVGLAQR